MVKQTSISIAARCAVVFWFLLVLNIACAGEGELELVVPVLDSTVAIRSKMDFAGAVSSLTFRGKEFIDSRDHGRLLQSASSFDGFGECFNPTEGGSAHNSQKEDTSVLKVSKIGPNFLATTVDMGFWLSPGQSSPSGCGLNKAVKVALNETVTSAHILDKRITIGLPSFPNVIQHLVTFHVPKKHDRATFEASTGYMPVDFSKALFYDPVNGIEYDAGNKMGEQAFPVILATPDNRYAMGVYSPNLPQNGLGYGRFSFPDVVKWNCVFREINISPKPYSYECLIVIGTLAEVEGTMRRLEAKFGHKH